MSPPRRGRRHSATLCASTGTRLTAASAIHAFATEKGRAPPISAFNLNFAHVAHLNHNIVNTG